MLCLFNWTYLQSPVKKILANCGFSKYKPNSPVCPFPFCQKGPVRRALVKEADTEEVVGKHLLDDDKRKTSLG